MSNVEGAILAGIVLAIGWVLVLWRIWWEHRHPSPHNPHGSHTCPNDRPGS